MKAFVTALCLWCLALPAWAGVEIDEFTTEGGLTVWHVEERSIPFIAMELRMRGGASLDEEGKRGATALATWLLEEGAGEMDARAYAKARDALAAYFSYDIGDDFLTVTARFLSENREDAMSLLRETLMNPRFDEDAITRVKAQVISGLRSDETDPEAIAGKAFGKRVYADHPYGSKKDGTVESVSALTRDDLMRAFKAAVSRERLYIAVVGDISREELGPMLDELLGDLPAKGGALPADAEPVFDGAVEVTDFATPQSVALFAQPGIEFDDPDYFAAYVMMTILGGGGFESRLMQEVREKRGLTYGVYAYMVGKDGADTIMGNVQSSNDRMAKAIEVIRAEWQRMHDEGATEEELTDAKRYLTGAYPLRFDGNAPIAGILANMQSYGMSKDYSKTRNDQINAVTLDDVNRVARELLQPEKLSFTVVGQPEGL